MTTDQTEDRNGDGRHDFQAATVSADNQDIVDNEGHRFVRGRVAAQDEAEEEDR